MHSDGTGCNQRGPMKRQTSVQAVPGASALVLAALLAASCSGSGSHEVRIADCVSGFHNPPGDRGRCVPNLGPTSASPTKTATLTTQRVADQIPADFQGQPARPCRTATTQQLLVFRIEPDTPQPPCWQVARFTALRVVNATADFHQQGRVVTGSLRGVGRFRLPPRTSIVLRLPAHRALATGDHCVVVNVYPGSCEAIWVHP